MYRKLGLQEAGITFEMPIYPGIEQHLMYVSVYDVLSGVKVGPIAWAMVWQKAAEYVDSQQIHGAKQMNSTRLKFYRFFAPVARLLALLSPLLAKKQ